MELAWSLWWVDMKVTHGEQYKIEQLKNVLSKEVVVYVLFEELFLLLHH